MEMKQNLQQTMEHLSAKQTEEMKAGQDKTNAKIEEMKAGQEERKAHQDKVDAEAKAHHEQLHQDINGYMEALLEGLRSCGKGTTICKVPSVVRPENSKTGLKEMEAAVNTFEEHSSKMDATDLEANSEATEAVQQRQELCEEEISVDNIGSLEDGYGDRRLAVRRLRGA
jgi:hypothetical protein